MVSEVIYLLKPPLQNLLKCVCVFLGINMMHVFDNSICFVCIKHMTTIPRTAIHLFTQ